MVSLQEIDPLIESSPAPVILLEGRREIPPKYRLLADRYATPLPQLVDEVETLAAKVAAHLAKMGAY